ncbi:unnamed protein product [marine sediment metagenome]|uniref:Zinc-ribbon domain-containing protein n=1 Tax=marine sediment metagenome TaxID=412755 RepID=X1R5Y8_9ZZZZ
MPRCTKCGRIYIGSTCSFCIQTPRNNKPSLENLGWDDSDKMIFDPDKIKSTKIEVHGQYVQGNIEHKTIHGDEIQQGATKIGEGAIVQRSKIGSSEKPKFCTGCGTRRQEDWVACPSCGYKF